MPGTGITYPGRQCRTQQRITWCVQNAQTWQVGRKHTQPAVDGGSCPGRMVQIQHRQLRQCCQHTQLLDPNFL